MSKVAFSQGLFISSIIFFTFLAEIPKPQWFSNPNTTAFINVNYNSANAQKYNFNFDLSDNANQSKNFNGNILISPPTAEFSNIDILVNDYEFFE